MIDEQPTIILFDGACNLCSGAVRFVISRDLHARCRFASLQSDAARAACAEVGYDLPPIFQRTACAGLDAVYRFAFTGRERCTLPA